MPYAKPADLVAVQSVISAPRMGTYLAARGNDPEQALELYAWNARISSALMLAAHFAEVSTRNAVDEALTTVYDARWPWNPTFIRSLPNVPSNAPAYAPRRDLSSTRAQNPTTGKVIAELKFVFWQKMFTARHDTRLWRHQIQSLFPGASASTPATLRQRIYDDLQVIRLLRNRIAHHEPIFARDLAQDLKMMLDLVDLRSAPTAQWVRIMEEATSLIAAKP